MLRIMVFFLMGCSVAMCEPIESINGLDISLPDGVTMSSDSPMEDFVICIFRDQSQEIARAYIGNHPSVPILEYFKLEDNKTKQYIIFALENDGKHSGELLFAVSERGWPQYVHFWYKDLTDENKRIVQKIIKGTTWQGKSLIRAAECVTGSSESSD